MYKNFFGFKERPFQLVPNPAYLFLSKGHEEALAHLTYAVSQGDGFVEITGEVGTGKTTLCRVFLENLGKDTEAAYIFNPRLDSVQLLKAINDEFDIPSKADNTKDLIDTLNGFLMEKKAEGKKVLLLIDEAQNLSMEILEQLRLLSNLETSTSKLLQIILVGQPELGQMLDSHELRQLGQRITLSCHLSPLDFNETRDYIQHRIQIASRKPGVKLTLGAYYAIHRFSGGIPRLINIACDRAFLTAFGLGKHKVTGNIANMAIRELAGRGERRKSLLGREKLLWGSGILLLIAVIVLLYSPAFWQKTEPEFTAAMPPADMTPPSRQDAGDREPLPEPDASPPEISEPEDPDAETETAEEAAATAAVEPARRPPEPASAPQTDAAAELTLEEYLMQTGGRQSRFSALRAALSLWDAEGLISPSLENVDDPQTFFRIGAKQNSLLVHRLDGDLGLVQRLNLPAILEFYPPGEEVPVYATLARIEEGGMVFRTGATDQEIRAEPHEVDTFWQGGAYVPWKDFFDFGGTIPKNASDDAVINLKMLLQEIGFGEIGVSPAYDEQVRRAVELIQERHGLTVDGVVGPRTKIILYNELETLKAPRLTSAS
jgi:general secretion pathway protein A